MLTVQTVYKRLNWSVNRLAIITQTFCDAVTAKELQREKQRGVNSGGLIEQSLRILKSA